MQRSTASRHAELDAVVVGSGPNGLAAAITIARTGRSVLVLVAEPKLGGGLATVETTLPGFRHDRYSAVHPFGVASPFFQQLPLAAHGLEWVQPDAPFAHPLPGGAGVTAWRSVDRTAASLGSDADRYRQLVQPLLDRWERIAAEILRPLPHVPTHPVALARVGVLALPPASRLTRVAFRTERSRGLLAGVAAHVNLSLHRMATSAPMWVLLLMAHRVGWPFPRGGAAALADALASHLRALGGSIETGQRIRHLRELPPAKAVLLDVTPRQLLSLADGRLPAWYRRLLGGYQHGPGVFKLDLALDAPLPWRAADVSAAGTVHLGGTLSEIEASEAAVGRGELPERPYVLLSQPTLFDPSRAPEGKHVVWAYCHVPADSDADMTEPVLRQIERFAPGARERILAVHASGPAALARGNVNVVGGDPGSGAQTLWQTIARPVPTPDPYATPLPGVYLCSAATPPGPGVHGMCGYRAAASALRRTFGEPEATPRRRPPTGPA